MRHPTLILLAAMAWFYAPGASGTTYIVRPDGTGDFPTIQAALDAAESGDTILLAEGTFVGEGNHNLDFLGKAITVQSWSGDPATCIIDCGGRDSGDVERGFEFHFGETAAAVVRGLTITNGIATGPCPGCTGGGVHCRDASSPTIENCVFFANTAYEGGGLGCDPGTAPTIRNCRLEGNSCTDEGGGIYLHSASPWIVGCLITANESPAYGGGAHILHGSARFEDCLFSDNLAGTHGGAVSLDRGWQTLTQCTFVGNTSYNMGGAIACLGDSSTITQCTFYGNRTYYGGGTIASRQFSSATVQNSILAFAEAGEAIYCDGFGGVTLSCCDIFGNAGGDWVGCIAEQFGSAGNICEDPLFCDAAGGNLRLLDGSPCAPFSPQNPECDLVGAWPVGCSPGSLLEASSGTSASALQLLFPNPFVERTWIRYTVPAGAGAWPVNLSIHDCSGRLVRRLVGGAPSSGEQITCWDGADAAGHRVPGGIYFCRLVVGEQEFSRRVLKIR